MSKNISIKIILLLFAYVTLVFALTALFEIKNNKNNNKSKIEVSSSENYSIIDNTEMCAQALEKIYTDKNYSYYLPCIKSENIYLKWDSGEIHKMMDDLNSGKVNIDSLINHGLMVYKYEK